MFLVTRMSVEGKCTATQCGRKQFQFCLFQSCFFLLDNTHTYKPTTVLLKNKQKIQQYHPDFGYWTSGSRQQKNKKKQNKEIPVWFIWLISQFCEIFFFFLLCLHLTLALSSKKIVKYKYGPLWNQKNIEPLKNLQPWSVIMEWSALYFMEFKPLSVCHLS